MPMVSLLRNRCKICSRFFMINHYESNKSGTSGAKGQISGSGCLTDIELDHYFFGLLPRQKRRSVDAHLERCPQCRFRLEVLQNPELEKPEPLPDDVRERSDVVLNLHLCGFYRHFLERFLVAVGGFLHVPWWAVHVLLYLLTWVAFMLLVDAKKFFPGWSRMICSSIMLAEFIFTTFMLLKVRWMRSVGFKMAARIKSPGQRLVWLRRHLVPVFWGWRYGVGAPGENGIHRVIRIRTWQMTVLQLFILYAILVLSVKDLRLSSIWEPYFPNLLIIYNQIAKCSMLTAVLSYFSFLSGLVQVASGRYVTSLDAEQRQMLCADCRRVTLQVSVIVGLATGLWMLSYGLSLGINYWSYSLSAGLLVLFVCQAAILEGISLRNFTMALSSIARSLLAPQPYPVSYRRGDILLAVASSLAPVILNIFGSFVRSIATA
jgi:hypothetical protein